MQDVAKRAQQAVKIEKARQQIKKANDDLRK
jgi:hypothetical protein